MHGPEVLSRQPAQSLQLCSLQPVDSERLGQWRKPEVTLRVRVETPPPQDAEHELHLDHSETRQMSFSVG